jgi:hypothetical protein
MNRSACSSSAGSRQRRDEEPLGASGRPRTVTDPTPTAPLARFDALFTEFQRPVLAYAMRRTATLADAEDATAETFTIAWRKLESIPPDAPLPWLYAVARRVLANQRRGGGRRDRLIALLTPNDDVPTPIRLGDDTDGPAFVALATLSPADQEILRPSPGRSSGIRRSPRSSGSHRMPPPSGSIEPVLGTRRPCHAPPVASPATRAEEDRRRILAGT